MNCTTGAWRHCRQKTNTSSSGPSEQREKQPRCSILALIAQSDPNVGWHSRNNKLNASTKQNILALHRGFTKIAMLTLPLTRSTLVEIKLRHPLLPKAGNSSSPFAPHQLNLCIRSCTLQNDHRCHQCISVLFTQITPMLCRSSPFHNAYNCQSTSIPPLGSPIRYQTGIAQTSVHQSIVTCPTPNFAR